MKNNYNILMNKRMKIVCLLLLLIVSIACFSCSRAEPQILFGFLELVYYPGRDGPEERYSFFILPEDDDGLENLDELFLFHDREGLRWLFTHNDWITHEEDGKTWIGTRSIAMRNNATLPRGQYRAVLVNKGGESTERRFTFDAPEAPPYPFPSLSVNDGIYRINSEYPINNIIAYDHVGDTLQVVRVMGTVGNLTDLGLQGTVRTIALWAEDPQLQISALTEAVVVR
jgi:hypothetical protein